MEFCSEHTEVIKGIAGIKADIKAIRDDISVLNKRINGSFDRIAKHIEEGEYWRRRIVAHDIRMKIYTWLFTLVNIGLFIFLTKIALKIGFKINV